LVEIFKRVPIFINLQRVTKGGGYNAGESYGLGYENKSDSIIQKEACT